MSKLFIFLGIFTLASAQFPDVPGVPPKPWRGPFADHINGIPPQDTPEVAAAKRALEQAYIQVLAVLPSLPTEKSFKDPTTTVPVQQHQVNYQTGQYVQQQNFVPPVQYSPPPILFTQNTQTTSPSPKITVFAEEIPRSPIGEVPEVHAARVAHLKAVQEAKAGLPPLPAVRQSIPQTNFFQRHIPQIDHFVQDTPEVARAKAEHAAAVAALG